jgi:cytochrome c peroxidase
MILIKHELISELNRLLITGNNMKNIGWIFILVGMLGFSSCTKETGKVPDDAGVYKPTLIDPTDIFPAEFGLPVLPKDNPFTEEGVLLGRMLFYDPLLSIDSSISCASCHRQEYAFTEPLDKSVGFRGLRNMRNSMPLFNLAYHHSYFWDSRAKTLRDLVFEPIQAHNEMAMTLPTLRERLKRNKRYIDYFKKAFNSEPNLHDMSLAMEQFLLSIVSKDSRFNQFFPGDNLKVLSASELRGAFIYNGLIDFDANGVTKGADCFHCHGGELSQQLNAGMGGIASNGLDPAPVDLGVGGVTNRSQDMGTFKAPSLLNIAVTAPYMHDGRFKTLEEVIDHYSDGVNFDNPNIHPQMAAHGGIQLRLSQQQKDDLVAYLRSMTDSTFLNNPAYSNPF